MLPKQNMLIFPSAYLQKDLLTPTHINTVQVIYLIIMEYFAFKFSICMFKDGRLDSMTNS